MINIDVIYCLVVVIWVMLSHWIADFILQTDEMAKGKSSCNKALTSHVKVYTLSFLLICSPLIYFLGVLPFVCWVLFNGACHWITDYHTSRKSSKLWAEGRVHDFFVCVGLDQFIHYVSLFCTLYFTYMLLCM